MASVTWSLERVRVSSGQANRGSGEEEEGGQETGLGRKRGRNYFKCSQRHRYTSIVLGLCESRGGRPGLSVLTSLLVSVDVKLY